MTFKTTPNSPELVIDQGLFKRKRTWSMEACPPTPPNSPIMGTITPPQSEFLQTQDSKTQVARANPPTPPVPPPAFALLVEKTQNYANPSVRESILKKDGWTHNNLQKLCPPACVNFSSYPSIIRRIIVLIFPANLQLFLNVNSTNSQETGDVFIVGKIVAENEQTYFQTYQVK